MLWHRLPPTPTTRPNFVFERFCELTNAITLTNVVVIATGQGDASEATSMRHAPLRLICKTDESEPCPPS